MKKILLFLIGIITCFSVNATDITFDATVTTSGNTTASEQTVTKDGVTLHLTNGILGIDGQYRIYKSQTLTVSSSYTITKIVFTCTANGTTKYGPGCFGSQTGYSYSGNTGTWSGSATSVAFVASSNQVRATSIVVTISTGGTTVQNPTISGTTPFDGSTQVTLSCNTTNATIYYTTNGQDPTTSSTQYSNPFTINQTTTVKAIAYKGSAHSSVESKEFVKIARVADIEELNNLTDNSPFIMDGNVVCLWQHGQYLYIQDATAATLIYGTLPASVEYNITDVIPYGWQGTKTTYGGFPEVTNATNFSEATTTQHINPTELDLSDISTSDWGKYVVARNVLISVSGGGDNPPVGESVTFDFNNGLSNLGLTAPETGTGTNLENAITYGGVTMSFTSGGTATRLWNTNGTTTLRVYKNGGSLTFTSSANFTSIVFDGTVVGSTDVGTWTGSSKTWTGNANSVTLTVSSNSTINSIVFTFASSSSAPQRVQSVNANYTIIDEDNNSLSVYPTKLGFTDVPDDLTQRYDAYGVLDFHNGEPQLLPVGFVDSEGVITSINEVKSDKIVNVTYYDLMGKISTKPFNGFNIVTIKYSDGSTKTYKAYNIQ